jgi:transposase
MLPPISLDTGQAATRKPMKPMMNEEDKRHAQAAKPERPEAEPSAARGEASGGSGLANPPVRWGVKRKAEVVLRLLRGDALDRVSRQTAVPVPRLEEWRTQALSGMEEGLKTRESDDPAQARLNEANRRIGELSMEVELLRARCEKNGPFVGRRSRP